MGERSFKRKGARSSHRLYYCRDHRRVWINYFNNDSSYFLYIVFRVVKICLKENDDEIKISLCGLSSILIFQMFIHIGVIQVFFHYWNDTTVLSYGGSSLIGSAILAGFILNYTKNRVD